MTSPRKSREDDVERGVGQRDRLGAGMHERERDAGFGHQPPGVLRLPLGQIKADGLASSFASAMRPLRRPAAETGEYPSQQRSRGYSSSDSGKLDHGQADRHCRRLIAVTRWYSLAVHVPRGTVTGCMLGQAEAVVGALDRFTVNVTA